MKTLNYPQIPVRRQPKTPAVAGLSAAVLVAAIAFLTAMSVRAEIVGPYTADTNTLFLLHFDEAAGGYVTTNVGIKGGNFLTVTNITTGPGLGIASNVPTMLGKAGYTDGTHDFGNCVSGTNTEAPFTNGLVGYDGNGNGFYDADVQGGSVCADAIGLTNLNIGCTNPATGAYNSPFTIEALICPTVNNAFQEIVCTDDYNGTRGFQFRMTSSAQLEFNFIGSPGKQILAPIPTTGIQAYASNTWFHVAVTYDGTNLMLYWTRLTNDAVVCSQIGSKVAWAATITNGWITAPLVIGNENRGSAQECFRGLIDEVRISKVCRGPGDMMFRTPAPVPQGPVSQNIDYYLPVTFSALACSPTPMGYHWRFNGTTISGATNGGYTIAAVNLSDAGDYDCVITNTAGYGVTSRVAHLTVGHDNFLHHRWSFDKDTTDSAGGATGTNHGNAVVSGGALVLDGTEGTYMELPSYLIKNSNYAAMTFSFWINCGSNGSNARVFDFGNTNLVNWYLPPPENYLFFSPDYGSTHALGLAGGSSQFQETAAATGTLAGRYLHVACVVDPPNQFMAIYTNGVLETNVSISTALDNVIDEKCWVGRSLFTADAWLNASIDELRIYGGALSPYGVYADYTGAAPCGLCFRPLAILIQPTNATVAVGCPARFAPMIAGNAPIFFQWYVNGTPVPGATNMSLTVCPTLAQNGSFFQIMATNNVGGINYSVVSSNATLTVLAPACPVITFDGTHVTVTWTNAGWKLQAQTNSLTTGLSTNWVNVAGSESVTNEIVPVNPTNGTVFYRLCAP